MGWKLALFVLIFALLPFEVQVWLVGLLRSLDPAFWFGLAGAALGSTFWYQLGWNSAVEAVFTEEVKGAEGRKKGRVR